MSVFSKNKKISKQDSTVILKSLRSLMGLGNSLFEAIVLQADIEEGTHQKILQKIIFYIEKKNQKIEELLLRFNLIDNSEFLILSNSKDTKESIEDIIKIRSISNNFNATVRTLVIFPIVGLFVGLAAVKFLLPTILKPIDELIRIIEIKKGIDASSIMNIPDVFFYVKHPEYANYIFIGFLILFSSVIFGYHYLIKNKPYLIYKFLPLKSYDDIPYIFMLMRALNKGGLDIYSIVSLLENSKLSYGWRRFFFLLKKQIERNRPVYEVFRKYRFPKQVYIIIKTAETSKSFWESFDNIIQYSEEINLIKNKQIIDRYKNLTTIFGYAEILFFLIGILLLMSSMQSLAMAMQ